MKVGKPFNTLTYGEYLHLIEHHKKFTDFNTLGLFRSILETTKLNPEQKIALRQVAIAAFPKTFDFLQLKDPQTYFEVNTLGQTLTKADENQAWENIISNQQKIWKSKRLNHRSFGIYSKHLCGYDTCQLNGMMIRQDSPLVDGVGKIRFPTDKSKDVPWIKSETRKRNRRSERQVIAQRINEE
jgi:hypothetical protein